MSKSIKKLGNDYLKMYLGDKNWLYRHYKDVKIVLAKTQPNLTEPFVNVIQKRCPDVELGALSWGLFTDVKRLKPKGDQSLADYIFSEEFWIGWYSEYPYKCLSHIVIEEVNEKDNKSITATIYSLSDSLMEGIRKRSVKQTNWNKTDTSVIAENSEPTFSGKYNAQIPTGSKVRFSVENQSLWFGDNEGILCFKDGEWIIKTKNSGMISIDKGLDAYSGTIEKV